METKLLIWFLTSYGLTNIIVYSTLFRPIREFFMKRINFIYELMSCVMCTGFWSGVLLSSLLFSPSNELFLLNDTNVLLILLKLIIDGLLSSGIVYIINTIVEKLER